MIIVMSIRVHYYKLAHFKTQKGIPRFIVLWFYKTIHFGNRKSILHFVALMVL